MISHGYGKVNALKAVTAVIWCEGDFDCGVGDVDGSDTVTFKIPILGEVSIKTPVQMMIPAMGTSTVM